MAQHGGRHECNDEVYKSLYSETQIFREVRTGDDRRHRTVTILSLPQGLLKDCHSSHAGYLFQQDKCYDVSYDTGDKSIQCGRKVDVLKLWLMWKAKGDHGFQHSMNVIFENAR